MGKLNGRVLISGASVAGLTTAYWLSRYGFEVTVVETAPSLRPGGQPLDVRGPALEVAKEMGVEGALRERATKLTGMSVVDAGGRDIFRSEERTLTGGYLDSPDIEILRDELCDVLFQTVRGRAGFLFGNSIVSLKEDESGVDVVLADGTRDRFDILIGADGLHSVVRRLAFGPEEKFLHHLGMYISVFAIPNFLGLERWQIFHQHGDVLGGLIGFAKNADVRGYISFKSEKPLDYDYRDITAQKKIIAERAADVQWEFPRILNYIQDTPYFHFDPAGQVCMDNWARGRIALVGDAGYCVSPLLGQGTTVAMVGAYVLAGELAVHKHDLSVGIDAYQCELRDYIRINQELARGVKDSSFVPSNAEADSESTSDCDQNADSIPDFGNMAAPFHFKDYASLSAR